MNELQFEERYTPGDAVTRDDKLAAQKATMGGALPVVVTYAATRRPAEFLTHVARTAQVSHPALALIIDWGQVGDRCFVAREDLPGPDLGALSGGGVTLPYATAVSYAIQAAGALEALHAAGIVHGGVSPRALVRRDEGSVLLVDAALAPATWPADLTDQDAPQAAAFRSPEEVLARPLTPAADVYSLGATLYQLVTGFAPMPGSTALQVAEAHVGTDPVPPRRLQPDLPVELERVILHCLAKQPDDRYASVADLHRDLVRVRDDEPVTAPPSPSEEPDPMVPAPAQRFPMAQPAQQHTLWPWLAATAVLAVLVLFGVLWVNGALSGGVKVPSVVGLDLAEAKLDLKDAGLELGAITVQATVPPATAPGTIVAQEPPAGKKVGAGSRVNVVVAGTATLPLPELRGLPIADAQQALERAGFKLDHVTEVYTDAVQTGHVVDQAPKAGESVAPGALVALAVSKGPAPAGVTPVTVPLVEGSTLEVARSTLESLGLTVLEWQLPSASVPAGTVSAQSPGADLGVDAGATVTIVVSTGPPATGSPAPTGVPSPGLSSAPPAYPPTPTQSPPFP